MTCDEGELARERERQLRAGSDVHAVERRLDVVDALDEMTRCFHDRVEMVGLELTGTRVREQSTQPLERLVHVRARPLDELRRRIDARHRGTRPRLFLRFASDLHDLRYPPM